MNEGHKYDVMEATSVLRIHIYPDSSEEILTVVSPISVDTESYNISKTEKKYNNFVSPSSILSPGDSTNNYYTDSGIDSSTLASPQQNLEDFSSEKRRESSSVYFVPINSHRIPEEEEGDIISETTLSFRDIKDNRRIGDSYQLTRSQEKALNSSSTINSSEIDIPELGEEEIYNLEDTFHEDYQNVLLKEGTQKSQTIEEGEKEIFVVGAEASVSYLLKNTIQEAGIVEATVFPKAYTYLEETIKIYPFTKKYQLVQFVPLYSLVDYIKTNKQKELNEVPLYDIVDYIKHPKKIELEHCDIKEFVDIKEDNKISVTVEATKENIGSVIAYRYPTTAQHLKIYYDIDINPTSIETEQKMISTGEYNDNLGKRTSIPLDEIYPSSKAFPQMNKHVYKHDIIRSNSITSVRSNAPDVNGIIDIQMSVGKNYTIPSTDDSFGFYVRSGNRKKNESTLVISHVKKNSPSDVCGLMIGDNIISINGILLDNLSLIRAERLYEESIKDKNITIKISREKKLKNVIKNEIVLLNKTPEMYDNNYHKRKEDYKISSSPQSDLGEELLEEDHHNHQNYHSHTTVPGTTSIYRSNNKNNKRNSDILNIKTQQQQSSFHNSHSPSTSVINSTVLNFSPNSYTTSGVDSTNSFSPRSDSGASSSGGMSDYKVSRVESKKKDKIGKVINFIPEADRQRYPNYSKYTTNIDEIEQDYHSAGLTPIHDIDSQPKLLRNYNYKLIEKSTQSPDSSRPYDRREVIYLPPNKQVNYEDNEIVDETGKNIIDQDALRKLVRQQRLPTPGDPFSKNRLDADNRYENVSKSLEKQIKKHKETTIKAVSGKKVCGHCDKTLGQGAAMIIESLKLQFHLSCFNCIECGKQLGNGTTGTDVRVRGRKLYCKDCYHNGKFETGTENRISTTSSKMLNRIQV